MRLILIIGHTRKTKPPSPFKSFSLFKNAVIIFFSHKSIYPAFPWIVHFPIHTCLFSLSHSLFLVYSLYIILSLPHSLFFFFSFFFFFKIKIHKKVIYLYWIVVWVKYKMRMWEVSTGTGPTVINYTHRITWRVSWAYLIL